MRTSITLTRLEAQFELHRRLRPRHLIMIILGGAIGTGLFVASGALIAQAGPGGVSLTYTLVGVMIYCLMTSLGEPAVYLLVSGLFVTYSCLYVGEGFGFVPGWNYWFALAVSVAAELAVTQLVMKHWLPGVSDMIQSTAFLLLMFGLSVFSVRGFGEAEYWFSMIKVVAIVVLLLIGLMMIFSVIRGDPQSGRQSFTVGNTPLVGGVPATVGVAMVAGFPFQDAETVGAVAGEAGNPSRTILYAIRQTFRRILLFYVPAILIIGVLLLYTDPNLLRSGATDVGVSPFALVFQHAGLVFMTGAMDAVVLTALPPPSTSSSYVSTRILCNLALEGQASRWFAKVSANGVLHRALLATSAVGALCFFNSLFDDQVVYLWLLNMSVVTCFTTWFGIALAHYRFCEGFTSQDHSVEQLAYRSPFFPFGPIMVAILCAVIVPGWNAKALFVPVDNLGVFTATYCGVVLFMAIWLTYRWKFKTRSMKYAGTQFSPTHLQQPEPTNVTATSVVAN